MDTPAVDKQKHYKILIICGGTAGITVAARLARAGFANDLAIVEPSEDHFYQPMWTLIAAGIFKISDSRRATRDLIPRGVTWVRDSVVDISGAKKSVSLQSGKILTCDWMVAATGVELSWGAIIGARDALRAPNVSSIYDKEYVEKTQRMILGIKSGRFVFTFPQPPVKCAGAPQKIMYLADEMLLEQGVREKCQIEYRSALGGIFGIPIFAAVLNEVICRKKIVTHFNQKLVEIRAAENKAIFADVATGSVFEEVVYDFLHVVPPMMPHKFMLNSDLCVKEGPSAGWVDVDPFSLRHKRWPGVFSLGDVCSSPNAKTGAAIRKQAPVVVANLISAINGKDTLARYDGYASCPLVTGFGKVLLAEFGYDGELMPSFPMNMAKESRLMWWLKKLVLPRFYWYLMLRGLA